MTGIYKILNIKNGKYYIGSSINLIQRFRVHKTHLRGGYHKNPHLQASWNKYGEENFLFSVLEHVSVEQLIEREIYYLEKAGGYKSPLNFNLKEVENRMMTGSHNHMYGMTGSLHHRWGSTHSKESRERISKNHADVSGENNNKAKLTWDKVDEIRELYPALRKEAESDLEVYRALANKYGVYHSTISKIVKEETWKRLK